MPTQLPNRCPNCELIIVSGAIFDAADKIDMYGPILGLSRDAKPEEAQAGYVGIGSLNMTDNPDARFLYQCPRCKIDLLIQ